MSYSFSVKAATKSLALDAVHAEMAKVVEHQPIHSKDQEAAMAVAGSFIDMLQGDDTRDVEVRMSGSLGYMTTPNDITSSNVSVSAYLIDRK